MPGLTLEQKGEIRVDEIVKNISSFGVPNFQRGSVWKQENKSALLESLYYDTPIGILLFWVHKNMEAHGYPIITDDKNIFQYFIVDGQQRIRTMYEVFTQVNKYLDMRDEEIEKYENGLWCVNITKLEDIQSNFNYTKRQQPLFQFIIHPKLVPNSQYRNNWIPLYKFFKEDERIEWEFIKSSNETYVNDYLNQPETKKRFRNMVTRGIFYKVFRNTELKDVIKIYNRINTSGIIVSKEENLYALLVDATADNKYNISTYINNLSAEIRQKEDLTSSLERMPENRFGFKFFMSIFAQASHYHFEVKSSKGQDLSEFENSLLKEIANHSSIAEKVLEICEKVVCFLNSIIKNELFCDDYKFLPDAKTIRPVLQLLIKFPELYINDHDRINNEKLLAGLILKLYMGDYEKEFLSDLVNHINSLSTLTPTDIRNILKMREKELNVSDTNTIQHRNIMMLYWLLRRKGARDFNNLLNMPENKKYDEQREICIEMKPERQHIIPFSKLVEIVLHPEIDKTYRNKKSIANNIGNITYISKEQNGLDALSNKFMRYEITDEDNLICHFLYNKSDIKNPLISYENIRNAFESKDLKIDEIKLEYHNFIENRAKLINDAFLQWSEELLRTENEFEYKSAIKMVSKKSDTFLRLLEEYKKRIPDNLSISNEEKVNYFQIHKNECGDKNIHYEFLDEGDEISVDIHLENHHLYDLFLKLKNILQAEESRFGTELEVNENFCNGYRIAFKYPLNRYKIEEIVSKMEELIRVTIDFLPEEQLYENGIKQYVRHNLTWENFYQQIERNGSLHLFNYLNTSLNRIKKSKSFSITTLRISTPDPNEGKYTMLMSIHPGKSNANYLYIDVIDKKLRQIHIELSDEEYRNRAPKYGIKGSEDRGNYGEKLLLHNNAEIDEFINFLM